MPVSRLAIKAALGAFAVGACNHVLVGWRQQVVIVRKTDYTYDRSHVS